jgi:hypothetical protein
MQAYHPADGWSLPVGMLIVNMLVKWDVNVHPTKVEVLRQASQVFNSCARRALLAHTLSLIYPTIQSAGNPA